MSGGRIRVSHARPRTRGRRKRGFDPSLSCYTCGEKGHFSRDCVEIWRQRRRDGSRFVFTNSHKTYYITLAWYKYMFIFLKSSWLFQERERGRSSFNITFDFWSLHFSRLLQKYKILIGVTILHSFLWCLLHFKSEI